MQGLNRMATELVDEAIDFADELGIRVHHLPNDAVVLDFGVDAPGGVEAGLLLAEIRTGGLATVQTRVDDVADAPLTHVELATDHAARTLLHAGAPTATVEAPPGVRGAGPGRLLLDDRADPDADFAVLALEADRLPDEALADEIADRVGLPSSAVFLPTAPPGSPCGVVASAARAAEAAVAALSRAGANPEGVHAAVGSAPVAPIDGDGALARSLDAVALGGRVHLVTQAGVDPPDDVVADARPSAAGPDRDAMEAALAPAAVTIDAEDGPTHVCGGVDDDALAHALGLCG